jgi:hypothetical protein
MAIEPAAEQQTRSDQSLMGRRWMVIAGAAVMAAVMLIGAFSIGVWVGSGRSENPALFGGIGARPGGAAQQPPGQAGRGAQALLGALSRPPDIVGRIQSFSGRRLTVDSQAGPQVLTLSSDTKVFLPDGSKGSVEDLARGRMVGVVGAPGDDGRSFMVEEVAVLPGAP